LDVSHVILILEDGILQRRKRIPTKKSTIPVGKTIWQSTAKGAGIVYGGTIGGLVGGGAGAAIGAGLGYGAAKLGFKIPKMFKKKK
jgi:hypothetical protein